MRELLLYFFYPVSFRPPCLFPDFGIGIGYLLWDFPPILVTGVVPMPDHDQRFKTLIKEFFPDFLRL
ncbi:MAG: hypothetical protein NT142_06605, partial [Planctomycetota bacterium]|nr:hypothetical protein [Planctomycetota bacterium]